MSLAIRTDPIPIFNVAWNFLVVDICVSKRVAGSDLVTLAGTEGRIRCCRYNGKCFEMGRTKVGSITAHPE